MTMTSITETPNELTTNLDKASPEQLVRLLRQCDAQIFSGWREHPGLNDQEIVAVMTRVVERAAEVLKAPAKNKVVLTGSGTSGRIAFFTSRAFNNVLASRGLAPCFDYIHAGEDPALFASREAPEDNWKLAQERVASVYKDAEKVLLVGITCGLSAPFVAGQIDYALNHPEKTAGIVLVGFNPVERARNTPIEGWDKTVKEVVLEMTKQPSLCFIVNPVIGPEPLTGSTRMKGGSATKVILEIIFERALALASHSQSHGNSHSATEATTLSPPTNSAPGDFATSHAAPTITATEVQSHDDSFGQQAPHSMQPHHKVDAKALERVLASVPSAIAAQAMNYEAAMRAAYLAIADISTCVARASKTLSSNGRIYYLGRNTYGIAAMIDASECQPTYNARFDDVRAYLSGGYSTLGNKEGDLSAEHPDYALSWTHFQDHVLPSVTENDLVVVVDGITLAATRTPGSNSSDGSCRSRSNSSPSLSDVNEDGLLPGIVSTLASEKQCTLISLYVGDPSMSTTPKVADTCLGDPFSASVHVPLSHAAFDTAAIPVFAEFAMKLVLNALTTGGFVLAGKAMNNRMIDLQVSNNKLYYRSIGIVRDFAKIDDKAAEEALLRSIYLVDDVTDEIRTKPISQHIFAAVSAASEKGHRVVPTAILLGAAPRVLAIADAVKLLATTPIIRQALSSLKGE